MKFATALAVALLLAVPPAAAETPAMFAKGIIEPSLHPWTIVTLPDETLVVEFRLNTFVAKQRDVKGEFGAIARTGGPAAGGGGPGRGGGRGAGGGAARGERG